tara:strand:- start:63 stop:200 length:138 start_codon:yes stop_codon:yes gene_type:complete
MFDKLKRIDPKDIDKYDGEYYTLNSYKKKKGKHKRAKTVTKNRSI